MPPAASKCRVAALGLRDLLAQAVHYLDFKTLDDLRECFANGMTSGSCAHKDSQTERGLSMVGCPSGHQSPTMRMHANQLICRQPPGGAQALQGCHQCPLVYLLADCPPASNAPATVRYLSAIKLNDASAATCAKADRLQIDQSLSECCLRNCGLQQ